MVDAPATRSAAGSLEPELATDADGVLTAAGPAFLALSGEAEDELVGRPLSSTFHGLMPASIDALLWENAVVGSAVAYVPQATAGGAPAWVRATLLRTGTGKDTRYRYVASAVPDAVAALVDEVYAALREVEAAHTVRSAAVAGGLFRLTDLLAERRVSYDGLVAEFDRQWLSA